MKSPAVGCTPLPKNDAVRRTVRFHALSETPAAPSARVVTRPPTGPTAYAQVNQQMSRSRRPLSAEDRHEETHAGITCGRIIVGTKGEVSRLMWVHATDDG